MNERFELNAEMVRDWLAREDRKQSFLSRRLNCSDSLVDRMLNGHVPKIRTLEALAALMGVQTDTLLLPKEATKAG